MITATGLTVVGIGDVAISDDPQDTIITYALGSCLGVVIYDPVARVGGMMHAMLPESSLAPEKAAVQPGRFVDTGVPYLFRACYRLGARKERLILKVAGGAALRGNSEDDPFQIGRRNMVMLRKLLWKNGVLIRAEDVGGQASRTLSLRLDSGEVYVKSHGSERQL